MSRYLSSLAVNCHSGLSRIKSHLSLVKCQVSMVNGRTASQSGMSTVYIIIIILLIIFAIMLSGGGGSLFSGNIASPVTPTPTGSSSSNPIASVSATLTPTPQWSINFVSKGCRPEIPPNAFGDISATGAESGYISLEINNGTSFDVVATSPFIAPASIYSTILSNSHGFNSKSWRAVIYSGSPPSGVEKAVYSGTPTACQ